MKKTLIAGTLAATMATSASAQTNADDCFLSDMFELAGNLYAGTRITVGSDLQERFIQECEEITGTEATGLSYGLISLEVNGVTIEFPNPE